MVHTGFELWRCLLGARKRPILAHDEAKAIQIGDDAGREQFGGHVIRKEEKEEAAGFRNAGFFISVAVRDFSRERPNTFDYDLYLSQIGLQLHAI
jgi:hypothetical protein